jgi:hypothetical protein
MGLEKSQLVCEFAQRDCFLRRAGECDYFALCYIERNEWCFGAARTILLFHTISARPPKQPRMVRTFLKVHTRPRLAYALRCRGYGELY